MKRTLSQFIVVGLAVASSLACYAEDARVLPAGRSRFSFVYAQTDGITQHFNDHGDRESLTAPYNMAINAENIKKAFPDAAVLINNLNNLNQGYNPNKAGTYGGITSKDQGIPIGDALSAGFLTTDATVRESQYNISYQYGITDRLTVGFIVPIVKAQVNFNGDITGTNTAAAMAPALPSTIAQSGGYQTLAHLNVSLARQLLSQMGYQVPSSNEQSGIGDVMLGGRYNYYKSRYEEVISSVQLGVALPTGALKDPTNPTTVDMGHGAVTTGLAHLFNYSPTRYVMLSNGIHYSHALPYHRNAIVGDNPNQFLAPASNNQIVGVQPGDSYSTNAGISLKPTAAFTLSAAYDWSWHRTDRYWGPIAGRDYGSMSSDTHQYQETVQLGASLSTIPSFLKKDFPLPTDVALNVYIPCAGVNVPVAPYGTAELALYF